MSASGTCYGMRETSASGTYYISAGLADVHGRRGQHGRHYGPQLHVIPLASASRRDGLRAVPSFVLQWPVR